MSNEINPSFSASSVTFDEPIMSKALPELTQDEFVKQSTQILTDGVAHHYSKEYVTDQLFHLAQENKNTAEGLGFPMDQVSIKTKVVDSWYGKRSASGPDPKQEPVYLVFDRSDKALAIYPGNTECREAPEVFEAGNNTIKNSNGPWPNGEYQFRDRMPHPESNSNGSYGPNGNFVFEVPGRPGMGIHSGRANDGGPQHPTLGCIRTTDEGTETLEQIYSTDRLQLIRVQD